MFCDEAESGERAALRVCEEVQREHDEGRWIRVYFGPLFRFVVDVDEQCTRYPTVYDRVQHRAAIASCLLLLVEWQGEGRYAKKSR